ncbi:MAG: hypothetical protein HGA22_02860 [Clostridiales bacterium]|nr:hypothetical protein [Clostridiales bacterium]
MILAREISAKTEGLVKAIESELSKPVVYNRIGDEQDLARYYGRDKDSYIVWLDDTLPEENFEISVIHMLLHLKQIERGVPEVQSESDPNKGEMKFSTIFAEALNELILDLEVEHILKEHYGIDTSYFSVQKLEKYKSIRDGGFRTFANNAFVQKHMGLKLAVEAYIAPQELADEMFACFEEEYSNIIAAAKRIQRILNAHNYKTEEGIFNIMKEILEYLKLAEYMSLYYKGDFYFYYTSRENWFLDAERHKNCFGSGLSGCNTESEGQSCTCC